LNWATRFISPEGKESRLSLRMLAKLDVEKAGRDTKPSADMSGLLEKSVKIDFCSKGCLREWGRGL
jgi:hypothetical protein